MTLLAACLLACATLVVVPGNASAHPLSTTAVLLDVGPDRVTGQVQLPLDRLAIALGQPGLTPAVAAQPAKLDELRTYVGAHLTATDATTGTPWSVSVAHSRSGPWTASTTSWSTPPSPRRNPERT